MWEGKISEQFVKMHSYKCKIKRRVCSFNFLSRERSPHDPMVMFYTELVRNPLWFCLCKLSS